MVDTMFKTRAPLRSIPAVAVNGKKTNFSCHSPHAKHFQTNHIQIQIPYKNHLSTLLYLNCHSRNLNFIVYLVRTSVFYVDQSPWFRSRVHAHIPAARLLLPTPNSALPISTPRRRPQPGSAALWVVPCAL